ncbi:hypothetical protein JOF53_007511 [Crossiella equi]|uniref:Uncharacterized protein n=1 Tax=Crossiella equi TaxID=130796 RepID=A0ABS5AQ07_9PSEU|nr:hypothetical protein [Crossiella equi]MBP2478639.1 hypothetical protein [Crossiella equi]
MDAEKRGCVLAPLVGLWLVVAPVLLFHSAMLLFRLPFSSEPTPGEVAESAAYWWAAAGIAGLASLATAVLAWRWGRRVLTVLATLVCLVTAGFALYGAGVRFTEPEPERWPPGRHCQERSGGDTTCPGG